MGPQIGAVKKAKNVVTGTLPIYASCLLIPICAPELIANSNTIKTAQQLETMTIF